MQEAKNKNVFMICIHTIFLIGAIILGFLLISKKINIGIFNANKDTPTETKTKSDVSSEYLENQLLKDLSDHSIDINGYLKNMLFAEYDRDNLSDRYYALKTVDTPLDTDYVAYEYMDQLNDTILRYYLNKTILNGVTFEAKGANESKGSESLVAFARPVHASSNSNNINLNKAILSGNGNFVIWYTDTGDSAITDVQAREIADNLERARYGYDKMYKTNYQFKPDFVNDGTITTKQTNILTSSGINGQKLKKAMQVYVMNYTENAAAKYVLTGDKLVKIYDKFLKGDSNGSIPGPYLLISTKAYQSDKERAMQIINRELFRHYQYNVFCPDSGCVINDNPYYFDALATFGSAMVTNKTSNTGFINDWVSIARVNAGDLFNEELNKKYGVKNIANSLAIYMYGYSNAVPEGTKKLIDALYQKQPFERLETRAGNQYLTESIQQVALAYLKQDMPVNLMPSSENTEKFVAKSHIYNTENIADERIGKLGIAYYILDKEAGKNYTIEFGRSQSNVSCILLGYKDGKYDMLAKSPISTLSVQFKTVNYDEYPKYYMIIANSTILRENFYSLNIVLE